MKLRKIRIENVRSFLDAAELLIDGDISIIIGPNGGGKTNLLDIAVTVLRRHLLIPFDAQPSPTVDNPNRYNVRQNDVLMNMTLEPHNLGAGRQQIIDLEVEVTVQDIDNMNIIKSRFEDLEPQASRKYNGMSLRLASLWNMDIITAGQKFTYTITNGSLNSPSAEPAKMYMQYLNLFEAYNYLCGDLGISSISMPMISLPVTRTSSGGGFSVALAGYQDFNQKRGVDASSSRNVGSILGLAVGRIASKFRLLLEKDNGSAEKDFYNDPQISALSDVLRGLGYDWNLERINPLNNEYNIRLKKQGLSFFANNASSGEKELLTYLFGIFALNVRDALVLIDEPELHLHPKWQKTLLELFEKLSAMTGNQFLLATHSPVFVSPASIRYVSRVYSNQQCSNIVRLKNDNLPDARHLFGIVNSHNNERLFFADKVLLVEGISDRLFLEAFLKHADLPRNSSAVLEVISVGGKGYFSRYQAILDACKVPYAIIADLDYVEEMGTLAIKKLFAVDAKDIKKDVIDNPESLDGATLVAEIDRALEKGGWENARNIWAYIKSRRRRLKPNLSKVEQEMLDNFLMEMRKRNIFILSKGSLEDYLPYGYQSKDIDKLLRLLEIPDFCWQLPEFAQEELLSISGEVMM